MSANKNKVIPRNYVYTRISFALTHKIILDTERTWSVGLKKTVGLRLTSTLGTWRPIAFNVLRCMNND